MRREEVGSGHGVAHGQEWGWGGASLLGGGNRPHHTEHLCAGFMGEFLGQWKTRPNSSNCETLPRTLPGEGGNSELGTPCPPVTAMHPAWGTHSPQHLPSPAPGKPTQSLLVPCWCPSPFCTALPDVRKAGTCCAPPFWGRLVPVVLWGVLVRQHLQVDGLGSPLDAPVLQGRKVPMGELDGAPLVLAPTGTHGVLTPTGAQRPFSLLGD